MEDKLKQITEILGAVNFSSHKQMREAIEGAMEIAETPSLNAGSLEQDFKEINVYLNDLYHNMTHDVKDAGHLWIAFNDKFNAFRERVFAASRPSLDIDKVVDAEKVLDFLLTESAEERIDMVDGNFYWREDKDGDQPLEPKQIIELYQKQAPKQSK